MIIKKSYLNQEEVFLIESLNDGIFEGFFVYQLHNIFHTQI